MSCIEAPRMAPLDVERVHPTDDATSMATEQIMDLVGHLPRDPAAPAPLVALGEDRQLGRLSGTMLPQPDAQRHIVIRGRVPAVGGAAVPQELTADGVAVRP